VETILIACRQQGVVPTPFVLAVSIADQTLSLFDRGRCIRQFSCSTSRFGIGQTEGSNCTPLGLHRIAEKIGAGEPAGTVFQSRQIVGHTSQAEFAAAGITTRILWLRGLEPGVNLGGNVDTHGRYVYLHGTNHEDRIGERMSAGCVLMRNTEIIELFDQVRSGDQVWIMD